MHLETLASHEGLLQPPHDLGFIIRQLVRVLRINRGRQVSSRAYVPLSSV
jgi:hypothetical protein